MPQLDIVSYFSQYLWTTLVFFGFFAILSKYFLPTIARALRFQEKLYSGRTMEINREGEKNEGGFFSFVQSKDSWKGAQTLLNESPSFQSEKNQTDTQRGEALLQQKKNELSFSFYNKSLFYDYFYDRTTTYFEDVFLDESHEDEGNIPEEGF